MTNRKNVLKLATMLVILFFGIAEGTSQVAKGTIRLGPELAYSSANQEIDGFSAKFKTTTLNLQLSGGYFVVDNLEIGLGVQLTSTENKVDSDKQTTSGTVIGPNVTYMVPIGENFYLPISGGLGYNSLTIDDDFSETNLSGLGYGVGVGIEYLVSNKIGARFSLIFNTGSLQDNDSDLELDVTTTQAGIGVNIYLNR